MNYDHIFFAGWPGIIRTVLCGGLAYLALVLLLRVSGKRTLAKMNAFDLVVTVAIGSILATIALSKDVALAEGAAAMGVLIGSQWIVAWLSARSRAVSRWVKAEPTLLFHRGDFLDAAMKRERVAQAEVRAAIRAQGHSDLRTIEAVILEADGSFSVIAHQSHSSSALSDVQGHSDS